MDLHQTLSLDCAFFHVCLEKAMKALEHVSNLQLKPLAIRMDGSRPVIEIEPPPETMNLGAIGGLCKRERASDGMRTTLATSLDGCLVEWTLAGTCDEHAEIVADASPRFVVLKQSQIGPVARRACSDLNALTQAAALNTEVDKEPRYVVQLIRHVAVNPKPNAIVVPLT